jgi:hypothetical protein
MEKKKQNKTKYLLIGMAVGIIIGMTAFYLFLKFGIIKSYYIFHGAARPNFSGFPRNNSFPRNFTQSG